MGKHIFYISSWYPREHKSEGTFIESQLLALREQGIPCAIMHTEEVTIGNYFRAILTGKQLITQRKHHQIQAVTNLVVHALPLRFSRDPVATRKKQIIAGAIKTLQKYIDAQGEPDVLFHHGIFDFTYITEALSKHFNIPYWFMEHSPNLGPESAIPNNPFHSGHDARAFVQSATRRFTVTHHYVEVFTDLFKAAFTYCPNVLTVDFFERPEVAKTNNPLKFVNIGILEPRKNQELLIRAFAKNFGGNHHFQLTIAGDGSLESHLRSICHELGVSDQVRITGFLPREHIKALLRDSHVFVLSSTSETFGVVLAEAMAFGLPVIAPNIGGPAELIDATTGITFAAGSLSDLSAKMDEISRNLNNYNPLLISENTRLRFGSEAFVKHLTNE